MVEKGEATRYLAEYILYVEKSTYGGIASYLAIHPPVELFCPSVALKVCITKDNYVELTGSKGSKEE